MPPNIVVTSDRPFVSETALAILSASSPLLSPSIPLNRIHLIGDSNGFGNDTDGPGYVGGWRAPLEAALRALRSDFDFVGSNIAQPESCTEGLIFHDTIAGATLLSAAAGYPGYFAAPGVGTTTYILDAIGTNDIKTVGMTLATLQARRVALDAVYDQYNGGRQGTIVVAVPPFVAGSGVGGNLAAWNALRVLYNQFLFGYCQNKQGYYFIDPSSTMVEFQTDGIHETRLGQAIVATGVSNVIDRILGTRQGPVLPRAYKSRSWSGSVQCAAAGDGLSVANHPGFNPGNQSFALGFDFYPTSLAAGNHNLAEYGTYNVTADYFLINTGAGRDVNLYWNAPGGIILGAPQLFVPGGSFTVNRWHRLLLLAHAPTSTIGIYLNGLLVGIVTGVAAWNFAQRTMTIGKGPTSNCAPGYYGNVRAYRGSAVPRPGTMAGQIAAENDLYWEVAPAPGNTVASFALDTNLADNISGNPPFVLVGGAAQIAAPPAGATPLRPWEYGF